MKKKNREALRMALLEFQNERHLFLEQVRILMEMDACGIAYERGEYPEGYDPTSGQYWEIKMDILEDTIEMVLEDEK